MRSNYLAERLELDPTAAEAAFNRLEGALNVLLPDSGTHQRYNGIEGVGLAAVIARHYVEPDFYNPLDPSTPERVSFMADNQSTHPNAWTSLETDEEILGGVAPNDMGRFTAFALAKINTLTIGSPRWSFRVEGVSIAPGRVGFAGGQCVQDSLLALSGLWEIHDHIGGKYFVNEVELEIDENVDTTNRTADDLAGEIEPSLVIVKSLQHKIEAAELTRPQLHDLLVAANGLVEGRILRGNKTRTS